MAKFFGFLATCILALSAVWYFRPSDGEVWHVTHEKALTGVAADVIDVDMFDTPASTIAALKAEGKKVICYVSIGTAEDWRADFGRFPRAVIGKGLAEWPGEYWLDIRATSTRAVIESRFVSAREKGCDGIDADNMDGYMADSGFALAAKEQLGYNIWASGVARGLGMTIGLKNDPLQAAALEPHFDFAIVESCEPEACEPFRAFAKSGKPVIQLEYGLENAAGICAAKDIYGYQAIVKDRLIDEREFRCR